MVDGVDAGERAAKARRVSHVAADQLHVLVEVPGPALLPAMDLRRQVVVRAHPMTVTQQVVGEMGTDEAGAAGDQNAHVRSRVRVVSPLLPAVMTNRK